jgi:hypothetical protein
MQQTMKRDDGDHHQHDCITSFFPQVQCMFNDLITYIIPMLSAKSSQNYAGVGLGNTSDYLRKCDPSFNYTILKTCEIVLWKFGFLPEQL